VRALEKAEDCGRTSGSAMAAAFKRMKATL
jgi:hypothetical protein